MLRSIPFYRQSRTTMTESTISTNHRRNGCLGAACSALLFAMMIHPWSLSAEESKVRRYAVIVANNLSLDEGVPPLQFADDETARTA
jgi:hypothetical protein